jgi:predicted nucleic acid-binding protein
MAITGSRNPSSARCSRSRITESEQVMKLERVQAELTVERIDCILEFLCASANLRPIFFLWRPLLSDPKDDFLLELAVESGADFIVTFNREDFRAAEQFGVSVLTPREFLARIGEEL